MKSDHGDSSAGCKSRSYNAQAFFERAKFIVHLHPQRLKNLGGRMVTPMTPDQLFDCPRQRESFAKGRSPAHLHDQARDPARGGFLTEFTKQASQFLFAVLIYNLGSGHLGPRVHAHVERAVSVEAETALRVFKFVRRNTKIEERTPDSTKAKLVENARCMPEVRLAHDKAPAEMRESLADMPHCIRILIQSQNIGTTFQQRLSVAAAAACPIHDEQTGLRLEQLQHFPQQHWTVVHEVLDRLRLRFIFGR